MGTSKEVRGPDGMHTGVVRELADVIVRPVSVMFHQSWQLGQVPVDWRKASVTPNLHKGGPRELQADQKEPHEVQQELRSPASGQEQPQAPSYAGGHPAGKQKRI